MNRIDTMFRAKKDRGESALVFYVTAGYPDLDTTDKVIDILAEEGADLVELGIPFSDPIADGPTIQAASNTALLAGTTVQAILARLEGIRQRNPDLPIVLFGAYNPIFHYGEKAFVEEAARCGADGLLIPDLPPEECGDLRTLCRDKDLSVVFLVAPTTLPERAGLICEASTGFVYVVSLSGVTGAREDLAADLEGRLSALREVSDKPLAVGFGISRPEQAARVAGMADGVIIGSALVKEIGDQPEDPGRFERVRAYVRSMREAVAATPAS